MGVQSSRYIVIFLQIGEINFLKTSSERVGFIPLLKPPKKFGVSGLVSEILRVNVFYTFLENSQ
jgi:hypothetical protein